MSDDRRCPYCNEALERGWIRPGGFGAQLFWLKGEKPSHWRRTERIKGDLRAYHCPKCGLYLCYEKEQKV